MRLPTSPRKYADGKMKEGNWLVVAKAWKGPVTTRSGHWFIVELEQVTDGSYLGPEGAYFIKAAADGMDVDATNDGEARWQNLLHAIGITPDDGPDIDPKEVIPNKAFMAHFDVGRTGKVYCGRLWEASEEQKQYAREYLVRTKEEKPDLPDIPKAPGTPF